MTKEYPWGKGTPTWTRDATANDSDKSSTVPAGKMWDMQFIYADLLTSATVGNRNLACTITDGANTIKRFGYSGLVAASQVGILFFSHGITVSTTALYSLAGIIAHATRSEPLPERLVLPAGYVIRIWDANAVDAAADDLTVVLHYVEYDA